LHEQHASQRGLVMRACVPAKRRSPPCLRCQRLSTYACILVLGISATQCHSWLRLWMASEPQDAAVKMRTLPRQLLRCQQGQGGSSSRQVDAAFASEAPRGLEEQFLEHQTTLPMMMAVILLCVGLMARQDAIIIFALFQFFCVMNSRSILQCLAAWKRVSSDMLEIYGDFAVVQPVLAKSLTSGVAYVLGDLIAQRVEGQPVINVGRCTHNGITGLILHGPILHFWILFLEGPFSHLFSNGDCLLAVLAKVAMDQTLFSATLNAAYALLLGILAGKTLEESMSHMRRTVPPAMFSSWRFWPIVHLVTYSSFMPIQFKVLWNDIAEVVWVAILSYIANVKAMNLNISEGPSGKQGKVSLSA